MGGKSSKAKHVLTIGHPIPSKLPAAAHQAHVPKTVDKSIAALKVTISRETAAIKDEKSESNLRVLLKALEKISQAPNKHVVAVGDLSSQGSIWSSGVGYGNGASNAKSIAAKKNFKLFEDSREQSIAEGLGGIAVYVRKCRRKSLAALVPLLKKTSLNNYVADRLGNDSMMDIASHAGYYLACWEYFSAMVENAETATCISRRLKTLMRNWVKMAESYRENMTAFGFKSTGDEVHEQLVECVLSLKAPIMQWRRHGDRSSGTKRRRPSRRAPTPTTAPVDLVEQEAALHTGDAMATSSSSSEEQEPSRKARKTSERSTRRPKRRHTAKKGKKKEKEEEQCDPAAQRYVETITPLTFGAYSSGVEMIQCSFMSRAMTELQSLASALPSLVHPDSSVFLRTNEKNIAEMQAMIVGPRDTPYQNGMFQFSIKLPAHYPASPPHCLITNTGGGRFRFNPNLYANGKVCLSLLGTWAGTAEEMWNESSTIYQVLVSIQSLILIAEPYYNEPSYQYKESKAASDLYNQNIRTGCVNHAMLDILRDEANPFRDAVKAHFTLKKDEIVEQLKEWNMAGRVDEFTALVDSL